MQEYVPTNDDLLYIVIEYISPWILSLVLIVRVCSYEFWTCYNCEKYVNMDCGCTIISESMSPQIMDLLTVQSMPCTTITCWSVSVPMSSRYDINYEIVSHKSRIYDEIVRICSATLYYHGRTHKLWECIFRNCRSAYNLMNLYQIVKVGYHSKCVFAIKCYQNQSSNEIMTNRMTYVK